jgi:hypothetical protein
MYRWALGHFTAGKNRAGRASTQPGRWVISPQQALEDPAPQSHLPDLFQSKEVTNLLG